MRTLVTAFLLGAVAVGLAAAAAAVAILIVADAAGWESFSAEIGSLVFVSFERAGEDTEATVGPGIAVAAVAGGVLNALGASLLKRRRDLLH
ncbi:MAG: hypothetical protein WD689_07285 [Gaiellaceae bacterium]